MTQQYTVQHDYRTDGHQLNEGDVVELVDAEAAHIERDSPGTLAPVGTRPANPGVLHEGSGAEPTPPAEGTPDETPEKPAPKKRASRSRKKATKKAATPVGGGAMSTEDTSGLTKG